MEQDKPIEQEVLQDRSTQLNQAHDDTQPQPPVMKQPKPRVKLDHYQTETDVVVTLYLKNQKQEDLDVAFSPQSLRVRGKLPGSDFEEEIHLANPINPDMSNFKVMSTKVEIKLRKIAGGSWTTLEAVKGKQVSRPVYPTSSKKSPTDWDKLEKEVIEEENKNPDDSENSVFSKLYEFCDDDTKKAMVKSMQESGGTQLNMNWEEVKGKRLEVTPPDGLEFRRYD